MKQQNVIVKNKVGLHARAASAFVNIASKFESDIRLKKENVTANGKSILNLLMLQAAYNNNITIITNGHDENEALKELTKLIQNKFEIG